MGWYGASCQHFFDLLPGFELMDHHHHVGTVLALWTHLILFSVALSQTLGF